MPAPAASAPSGAGTAGSAIQHVVGIVHTIFNLPKIINDQPEVSSR